MPQAIAAAAQYVAMTVFQIASAAGASVSTAATIANIAAYATQIGLQVVTLAAVNAVLNKIPSPEAAATTLKQTIPPRITGYGLAKVAGAYMLYEAYHKYFYQVQAMHHGKINRWTNFYIGSEEVFRRPDPEIDPRIADREDGAWGEHVRMWTRQGETPETPYDVLVAEMAGSGLWTNDCRGDGIASIAWRSESDDAKHQGQTFPQGIIAPSAAGELSLVYDWRVTGQDPDDPDTWEWSDNPVLALADYLTNPVYGMGFSWAERFVPLLELWTAAADYCDDLVDTVESGQIKRYTMGGWFYHGTAPADVVAKILECFDGWLSDDGQGHFVVYPGQYYEPVVTLGRGDIVDYSLQRYVEDEQATNEFIVSFVAPERSFAEVQTDPWRDEDDVAARGQVRSSSLQLTWVNQNSQARRLAKRAMSRALSARGTVKTNLGGLRALGQRFVMLDCEEVSFLQGLPIEVQKIEVDIAALTLTFSWIAADPLIDSWNPETEEGAGPIIADRAPQEGLEAPEVLGVDVVFEDVGGGTVGARLLIHVLGPDLSSLLWFVRWRVAGAASWNEEASTPADGSGGLVSLPTGFVPVNDDIEYEATYETAGGLAPWSGLTSTPADTTVAVVIPPPTLFAVAVNGTTQTNTVTFRYPTTPFDAVQVFRSATPNFVDAVQIGGDMAGALGAVVNYADAAGYGYWRYWVRTKTGAAYSTVLGPIVGDTSDGFGANLLAAASVDDFTHASWVKDLSGTGSANPVVTANNVVGLDGVTMNADTIVFVRGASGFSRVSQTVLSLISADIYEEALYLKAPAGGLSIALRIGGTVGPALNLTTSWQRYALTAAPGAGSAAIQLILWSSVSGSPTSATVHATKAKFKHT